MTKHTQESNFTFDELFYSKTDRKGTILSGNLVFQRVSEYTWENLIGRPHNMIRHPDMPRGVFHLFWEFLNAEKPIGAFVKNKSKSGKHYWVVALAMPTRDGFLSVRIKPGGELLSTIEKEYSALRAEETTEKLTPKESQAYLLKRISALGFSDYSSFMSYALSNQIENRNQELKIPNSPIFSSMKEMRALALGILEDSKKILDAYTKSKFVPLNLEVYATKLGNDGKQLSVVASQYQKMVEEINREIDSFSSMSKEVIQKIETGQFYVGASQLMEDVTQFLEKENGANDGINELKQLSEFYLKNSETGIREIADVLNKFKNLCETLQTMGSGLELVRITGKIETARISQETDVSEMLNGLRGFQTALSEGLKNIFECQPLMNKHAKYLLEIIFKKTAQ